MRKDLYHYGCAFNIAMTFFEQGKNQNALKWFRFAKKMEPTKKEPYLGEATAAFKLGLIDDCL
jgi:hypothetical protein